MKHRYIKCTSHCFGLLQLNLSSNQQNVYLVHVFKIDQNVTQWRDLLVIPAGLGIGPEEPSPFCSQLAQDLSLKLDQQFFPGQTFSVLLRHFKQHASERVRCLNFNVKVES